MTTKELKQLEKHKEDFIPVYSENPYLVEFDKTLKEIDKKTLWEFVRVLNFFKGRFIEQTMQIFPFSTDEMNYRNGVVIEMTKLIKTIEQYSKERPDPVFRDNGALRSELKKSNNQILS